MSTIMPENCKENQKLPWSSSYHTWTKTQNKYTRWKVTRAELHPRPRVAHQVSLHQNLGDNPLSFVVFV